MSADRSRSILTSVIIALVGVVGIALVQPGLAKGVRKVRQRDDVFLLPPPTQLRALTLGYRAAVTDLLWAKLILEWGLHAQEKRAFPDSTRYIDGILALEPDFPTVYKFIDTLLVYNTIGGTEEDARTARRYLEMGTRERPYDPAIWLQYGQFTAFLAPSFLKDEKEIERWRLDGALAIAHAVELGSGAHYSLAASSILGKAGERKATIEHLQRTYVMTEDPEMREQVLLKLRHMQASADSEAALTVVEREWRSRYPFLSREAALLIGPRRSPSACAGPGAYDRRGCPLDWEAAIADTK